jgi:hypothetical protein
MAARVAGRAVAVSPGAPEPGAARAAIPQPSSTITETADAMATQRRLQ